MEYYTEKEVKEILKNKEKLVYADNGMTEVMIKKDDISDFIVSYINEYGHGNKLKIIDSERGSYSNPTITTMGWFLDKCHPETREEIIDRLILLQTTDEKPKNVKLIDEDMLEEITNQVDIDEEEFEKEEFEGNY